MPKSRKVATFTFDQRGWSELYKHIKCQVSTQKLDDDILELNLTGSKVKSSTDLSYFYKTIKIFTKIRTLILKNMCLESLDFVGQLLCTRLLTCKIMDISDNKISKDDVSKFIDSMEGRSITKEVPPIWIVTDYEDMFTKNFACCSPYKFRGCICNTKRFVHVGRDPMLFMYPMTTPKDSRNIPPPPECEPPPPPFIAYIRAFDEAKQQFEFALSMEREQMHTISVQGDEYVLVEYDGKFEFMDFNRVYRGLVPKITGEMLPLSELKMIQGGKTIAAITDKYYVDSQCTTPDSYLCSDGGEKILIRPTSYNDGFIAATIENQCEWKWFPLSKCSL
jgi:hypothetical protein